MHDEAYYYYISAALRAVHRSLARFVEINKVCLLACLLVACLLVACLLDDIFFFLSAEPNHSASHEARDRYDPPPPPP